MKLQRNKALRIIPFFQFYELKYIIAMHDEPLMWLDTRSASIRNCNQCSGYRGICN